jgi:hypothetical protein
MKVFSLLFSGFIIKSAINNPKKSGNSNEITPLNSPTDDENGFLNKDFFRRQTGIDERYPQETKNENYSQAIYNITQNINKLKILNILESDFINEKEKLNAIDEYNYYNEQSKYVGKITNGGLFDDWNMVDSIFM